MKPIMRSKKQKQVINAFKPKAVIEFTATAVEAERVQRKTKPLSITMI
jgi:hypothetical protein